MNIDFDYIEKLSEDGRHYELMLYVVPLLQQFDDWAEQNRFWYKCAKVWKRAAKVNRDFYNHALETAFKWKARHYKAEALAAKRLELLRRVYEEDCYPCLFCGNGKDAGHDPDCDLAAELGE